MKPHPKRAEIIALRKRDHSIQEISTLTGVCKSTVHYTVKDIELSKRQVALLREKSRQSHKDAWTDERKAKRAKVMRAHWRKLPKKARARLIRRLTGFGTVVMNLAYRKDELPVKSLLERLFKSTFTKEHLNGRYFDFSSKKYLIEWSLSPSSGIHDIIRRFESLTDDTRKRIAYVDTSRVGKRSMARLMAAEVDLRDCRDVMPNCLPPPRLPKPSPFVEIVCAGCRRGFVASARVHRYKVRTGQLRFYCSRTCGSMTRFA